MATAMHVSSQPGVPCFICGIGFLHGSAHSVTAHLNVLFEGELAGNRWQNERDDVGAPLLGLPGGGGCRSAYELRLGLRPIDREAVLIKVFVLKPAHAAHFEKAFPREEPFPER